jgi:hypothetical protein
MKDFLLACDFLGFQPSLHIEGKKTFSSTFTGVLSILVVIISLLCTGYFGSELFVKSSPTVIVSKDNEGIFPAVNVSNQGFLFMAGLEYANFSYYSDPTIFEVNARRQVIYNDILPNGTVQQVVVNTDIEMSLCSKYYKNEDLLEKNLNIPLDLFYCAKPNTAYIEGFWGATTSPYVNLRVEFTKCRNTTKNNFHCKSPDEINSIIQNGYLSLDFTTYDVDPKNYENPLQRVFFNDYNLLNPNSSLEYSIDLFPKNFKSDDGLMFEDIKILEGLDYNMRIFNRNTPSDYIFSMVFQGNPTSTKYIRSYVKLQTVLTQIGGFIKAIMLVGSLISMVFSKNFFFVLYLNQICNSSRFTNEGSIIELSGSDIKEDKSNTKFNACRESNLEKINKQISSNALVCNNKIQVNHEQLNKNNIPINVHLNKQSRYSTNLIKKDYQKELKISGSLYYILLNYILNNLFACSRKASRNSNYKLVLAIKKLYENFTSVDNIFQNSFQIKAIIKDYYKETSEKVYFKDSVSKIIAEKVVNDANLDVIFS